VKSPLEVHFDGKENEMEPENPANKPNLKRFGDSTECDAEAKVPRNAQCEKSETLNRTSDEDDSGLETSSSSSKSEKDESKLIKPSEPNKKDDTSDKPKKLMPPPVGKYILRQIRSATYTREPAASQDPDGSDFRESDAVLHFGRNGTVQIGRARDFCQIPVELVDNVQISRRHAVMKKMPDGKIMIASMVNNYFILSCLIFFELRF
jgi:hypothetical protein